MNTITGRLHRAGLALTAAVAIAVWFGATAPAWAQGNTGGGQSQTFLGQVGETATAVNDSPAMGGLTSAGGVTEEAFKKALEQGLTSEKYAQMAGKAGKYIKFLDIALKTIKFADLAAKCNDALASGDRDAFAKAFNTLVREAVKTAASTGGSAGGAAAGTAIAGTLGIVSGPGAIIAAGIGGFAGGWAGGTLAEWLAGKAYDKFMQDYVTDMGGQIFDAIKGTPGGQQGPGGQGPGTGLPPPGGQGPGSGKKVPQLDPFR